MAGDGSEYSTWQKLSCDLGISANVTFTGYIKGDQKINLLSECDLLFFPTRYGEGMPNVVLEAMGNGLVIVSTPVGGIKDIIKTGVNGWLINNTDPNEFAKVISEACIDTETVKRISSNNIQQSAVFEIRQVIKRFDEYYNNILKEV